MYLGWFDDSPRRTPEQKLDAAVAAYTERFGFPPNIILANPEEPLPAAYPITIRRETYICLHSDFPRRCNFWLGWEEYSQGSRCNE